MGNFDNMIQDYIDGLLDAQKRKRFEEQLKSDKSLRAEVEMQKYLKEVIAERTSPEANQLKSTIIDTQENYRSSTKRGIAERRRYYLWVSIAAACLLLVIFNPFKSDSISDLYNVPVMHSEVVRGGGTEGDSYEKAKSLYDQKLFKEARTHLDRLISIDHDNVQYIYYRALTFYGEEDWDNAVSALKPISQGNSVFAEEAIYYLAICQYRLGNKEDALHTVHRITRDSDKYSDAKLLIRAWSK